ncbi:Acetyl-CoA acetyltransferase, mitochondrial [Orchesella cincta]|uniref:Acetyl-CoA acetyltransferase, mitochondrial n=1 Tax=Orchesella cincta TaxID=48709 RepID=A0A1D2NK47_ORCCI|nr:Acetyl-CoA acetyltransferase, mitochondrial [Orchesella cincta]
MTRHTSVPKVSNMCVNAIRNQEISSCFRSHRNLKMYSFPLGFQIILNKWPLLALLRLPKRCKSRSISKTEDVFERKVNEEVLVMSAVRTIGSFCKSLSSFSAPQLGAFAIKEAIRKSGFSPKQVQEVYIGNGFQAGVGQAPARQATIFGGLPADTVDCTTINKLEASGMKSIMLATLNLKCGDQQLNGCGWNGVNV